MLVLVKDFLHYLFKLISGVTQLHTTVRELNFDRAAKMDSRCLYKTSDISRV